MDVGAEVCVRPLGLQCGHMKTEAEATIEDLYCVPEDGKAEIVNGEIVLTPVDELFS